MTAPLLLSPLMLPLVPHLELQCSDCSAAYTISLYAPCSIVHVLSMRIVHPSKTL